MGFSDTIKNLKWSGDNNYIKVEVTKLITSCFTLKNYKQNYIMTIIYDRHKMKKNKMEY